MLPILGRGGRGTGDCLVTWWAVSPNPPGTQSPDSGLRRRRGEVGSLFLKPEAQWAPLPCPTLTHPDSSPDRGRSAAATVPSEEKTVPP